MTYAPIRYSGYRISLLPKAEQMAAWTQRLKDIEYLLPLFHDALRERYFADDAVLDMDFNDIIRMSLHGGELFGCVHGEGDERKIIGFVLLRDIRPGRDAWMEGYVVPEYRGKYPVAKLIRQVIQYAFSPWNPESSPSNRFAPRGLGLRKIKATVSGLNAPAARFMSGLGFIIAGVSYMDGLFKGEVTDIILLEKFNPAYFPAVRDNDVIRRRGREGAAATNAPSIHTATGVSERPGLPEVGPDNEPAKLVHPKGGVGAGRVQQRSDELEREVGVRELGLAEPGGEPDGQPEHGPSRKRLSPKASAAAVRARRVKPVRKRTGRE